MPMPMQSETVHVMGRQYAQKKVGQHVFRQQSMTQRQGMVLPTAMRYAAWPAAFLGHKRLQA